MTIKKTLRFDDVTARTLAQLAAESGKSQAQAAADAISAAAERRHSDGISDGTCAVTNDALLEALRDQIDDLKHRNDRLDQQIEHLQLLLSQSHQLLNQRPALPAAKKGKKKAKKKKKKGK